MSKIGLLAIVLLVIVLLATLVSFTGCASVRHSGFIIPARCVRVNVQSFTRPCTQRQDGKFVCDGVVITASCVAPPVTATTARWRKAPNRRGRIGASETVASPLAV